MHDSQFQVFLFLGFIFFWTFFPEILFPETLLAAPILPQEKKSRESKTQDFISSDFFSKDLRKFGLFSKVFISRFFSRNFFSRDFLTQILCIQFIYCRFGRNLKTKTGLHLFSFPSVTAVHFVCKQRYNGSWIKQQTLNQFSCFQVFSLYFNCFFFMFLSKGRIQNFFHKEGGA